MNLIRMRALRPFRLSPQGPWIAEGAVLHLKPTKAHVMQMRGHVEPLPDDELAEMEPGWFPMQTEPQGCGCGKKKEK